MKTPTNRPQPLPRIPISDSIQRNGIEGCIFVNETTIPVSVVPDGNVQHVSRRKTGNLGDYLDDISKMLTADQVTFNDLMKGKTVKL